MPIERLVKIAALSKKKLIFLLKSLGRLWLPVFILKETASPETKPLVFAYAGYSSTQKKYLSQLVFGQKMFKSSFSGVRSFRALTSGRRLKKLRADILIAEVSSLTHGFFMKQKGHLMPEFVEMKISIADPMEIIKKRSRSDIADVERLIRKYQWRYSVTRDQKAYHDFFYEMYLPYIKARYSERAILPSFRQYQELCQSAYLLLIHRGQPPVAGALVVYDKNRASLNRLGLKDGKIEYLKQGVIGAIYYFNILECQKMGYGELELGGTYPFLSDGLTKYKRGMTGEFMLDYEKFRNHLWILSSDSEAAREFFKKNPFVSLGRDWKLRETFYDEP